MSVSALVHAILELKDVEREGITFIKNEDREVFVSYKELYRQASRMLNALRNAGICPAEEVVFQVEDNELFVPLFWACMMGGFLPVPVTPANTSEQRLKLMNIWAVLKQPRLVIDATALDRLLEFCAERELSVQPGNLRSRAISLERLAVIDDSCDACDIYRSKESDIALIQFSSGSTGDPKGVTLTHKNLVTNVRALAKSIESRPEGEVYLSWMPLTHDMGLIAFHLVPLMAGWPQFLMPPNLFVRRPLVWLEKMSEHRVTVAASPNFGFKHVLKVLDSHPDRTYDLSSVRLIFNAAEPISASLCRDFLRRLAPLGLRDDAMFPGYGLAEASVAVSVPPPGRDMVVVEVDRGSLSVGNKIVERESNGENTVSFVGVGRAVDDCFIRIVDGNDSVVDDRVVGRIQMRGDNVTAGYYRNEAATAAVFSADGWLDTGDLGFMRDGELVVTGRMKDIIFANGQNFYSHDLERLADQIEGFDSSKLAAAGIFNQEAQEDEVVFFVVHRKKQLEDFAMLANELKTKIHAGAGLKVRFVIPVKTIPKTTSGKVQRYKLVQDYLAGKYNDVLAELTAIYDSRLEEIAGETGENVPDIRQITTAILNAIANLMGFIVTDLDESLFELGLESVKVPQLQMALEDEFDLDLPVSLALDYPSVNDIALYIRRRLNGGAEAGIVENVSAAVSAIGEPVAIIGIGCRFPGGADDPSSFWRNLVQGQCAITRIPRNRWDAGKYYDPSPETPGKINTMYGGFLDGIDLFEPAFFGITPMEAQAMDPQQRLLLEVCWHALENAGLDMTDVMGSRAGCFIGISGSDYIDRIKASENTIGAYSFTGSMLSTASGRISHFFRFNGPSVSIDTACSSSLLAVEQAVMNVRAGRCDLALAGGVNLILSPKGHIAFSRLNVLSPDGRCKSFDDSADGYGRSEGCGIVVLKRLSDARQNGDTVLASIAGTSVMHNGGSSGLTVPNGVIQEKLIREALFDSGVTPGDIDYIEAHGSGTKLGDPQEINALANVFGGRNGKGRLLVGSVKSNIGHTESAAGIAGLIKVVLALKEELIPMHLHVTVPNRLIRWDRIDVDLVRENLEWKKKEAARYAGVSSFGISGTNAHIVLRDAPDTEAKKSSPCAPFNILTVSGRDLDALERLADRYCDYLSGSESGIGDICYTSNISRTYFPYRLAVVGKSKDDFVKKLKNFRQKKEQAEVLVSSSGATPHPGIVFLFSGQGSVYEGAGKELYETFPVFKEEMDRCDRLFSQYAGISVVSALYPSESGGNELARAVCAQSAIFSIQYSLVKLWESWGIGPSAVAGHSIGEYAAAWAAGVLDLENAVKLVAMRGKLMQSVPASGKMVGLLMSEDRARQIIAGLEASVSIAAVNSSENITISGESGAVDEAVARARQAGYFVNHLDISHPFHSVMMAPLVGEFRKEVERISFAKPKISIISTQTGKDASDEFCSPGYWSDHLLRGVRFYDAVLNLENKGCRVFLEIGATAVLSGIVSETVAGKDTVCVPSLRKGNHALRQIYNSLANLYACGACIDWRAVNRPFAGRKVMLPGYPFMRERFWITCDEPDVAMPVGRTAVFANDAAVELKDIVFGISGLDPEEIDEAASLFGMGLDSLMLGKLKRKISENFAVDIPLNDFYTKFTTIQAISAELQGAAQKTRHGGVIHSSPVTPDETPDNGLSPVERMKTQALSMMDMMQKQLDWLNEIQSGGFMGQSYRRTIPELNFRGMTLARDRLTREQERFLSDFIERFCRMTRKSKEYEQRYRYTFSHWLTALNFRASLKEIIYPLIASRAEGAYFWDLDDNKYIDIALGYGVHYFGHRPGFITKAIDEQLRKGYVLSPHPDLLGETASLICELTGVERVAFCNTGSEAVMFALRLARAVTGRMKIIRFAGSYHGVYDAVLAEADEHGVFPSSPGIPLGMVQDVEVLPYGSDESLSRMRELGPQLAAVLVEPVQSRRPGFQPEEFLRRLRILTREIGALLIFDEMITGFRICPGGAQAYFGVEADMATYGKIVGGGMPIGIVAGKREYLDAVDGGSWNFGDDTMPAAKTAFVAGTFANHPLALASARAALSYMKEAGPRLQEQVNQRTAYLASRLNRFFDDEDVPVQVRHFGSVFRFESFGKYDLSFLPLEMDLFFYLLMSNGIYTWERRICFLSTVHSDEDADAILRAVKESVRQLRSGGFAFCTPRLLPASQAQKRFFILNQMADFDEGGHLPFAVRIAGDLDIARMESSFRILIQRHQALRTGFVMRGDVLFQKVHDAVDFTIVQTQITDDDIERFARECVRPFDLTAPPLFRLFMGKLSAGSYIFLFDAHHIMFDGYSGNILFQELMELYRGNTLEPLPNRYTDYMDWLDGYRASDLLRLQEAYWLERFASPAEPLALPLDFPRPQKQEFNGLVHRFNVAESELDQLKKMASRQDVTLFVLLLTAFYLLIDELTGQEMIQVGIPVSVRDDDKFAGLVGFCSNTVVLKTGFAEVATYSECIKRIKSEWLEAYLHKDYPYEALVENPGCRAERGRNPLFDVMFIYENGNDRVLEFENTLCTPFSFDSHVSLFDLTMEIIERRGILDVNVIYNTSLFKQETIVGWSGIFTRVLADILRSPDSPVNRGQRGSFPGEKKAAAAGEHRSGRAPENEVEEMLFEIWKQVLRFSEFGCDDNFFDLGGRSFETIHVMSGVNQRMKSQVPFTALFEHPTIGEMARYIQSRAAEKTPPATIAPAAPRPYYNLSPIQTPYWYWAQRRPGKEVSGVEITDRLPVLKGALDVDILRRAFLEVTHLHGIFRTTYAEIDNRPVQVVHDDLEFHFHVHDLSSTDDGELRVALSGGLLSEYRRPFKLDEGPLCRADVFRIDDETHILFLNAPHASFDGWSFSLTLREMARQYNNIAATGHPLSISPGPLQYVDYAEWHNKRLANGELDGQRDYWELYLQSDIQSPRLPGVEDYGIQETEPAKIYKLDVGDTLSRKIYEMALDQKATPFAIMMAVMNCWVSSISAKTVITLGTVFSGRTHPDLEGIPGIMLNSLPVRLDLGGNPQCAEIFGMTKKVLLETYRYQDFPLERIAHKKRKVLDLHDDFYSIVFVGQESLEGSVHFDRIETRFSPLFELMDSGCSGQDGFFDFPYQMPHDFLIEMWEMENRIILLARYNHQRFSVDLVKSYFDHFIAILHQCIESPDVRLSQLPAFHYGEYDNLF